MRWRGIRAGNQPPGAETAKIRRAGQTLPSLRYHDHMNLGFTEMLFIFLVALIIFGPRKLPEIGRQVGKALAEFKRASNGFKSQLELEMRQIEIEEAIRKEKEALVQTIQSPTGTVGSTGLARAADNTPSEGQDSPYPPVDVSAAPQQSPYPPNDVTNSDAVKRDNA